nr:50S ribosomal protein L25/general stress protein Ctc [Nakamurella sp. PAMC28650]
MTGPLLFFARCGGDTDRSSRPTFQEHHMAEVRLSAESRTEFGKGFARRIRAVGKIPAVLYGHGTAPRHLTLQSREFSHAIKGGANTILTLALPDGDELALAKSVVRHPLRDYFEHVDLIIVKRGERVTVDIPILLVGEAAPGSTVLTDANTLSIEVEALHIPQSLEVSLDGLEIGSQVLASQVVLPDGATLISDPDTLVVAVSIVEEADSGEEDEVVAPTAETPEEA